MNRGQSPRSPQPNPSGSMATNDHFMERLRAIGEYTPSIMEKAPQEAAQS